MNAPQADALDDAERLRQLHCLGQAQEVRSELAGWVDGRDGGAAVTRLYAMLLVQWRYPDQALAMLEAAVRTGTPDALLYNDIGALHFQRQYLRAAEAAFARALELDPALESARDNAMGTRSLLATAEGFLHQAREARNQWNLEGAVRLADQALGLAADVNEAVCLRHGAMIELGDYALAARLPAEAHDARDFSAIAQEIVAGTLRVEAFPCHRRQLAGFVCAGSEPGVSSAALASLRRGLEAAADENYAVAIRWLMLWVSDRGDPGVVRLQLDEQQRFVLKECAEAAEADQRRDALLLELALRLAQRPLAQAAGAAYLRWLRAQGKTRQALLVEQFLSQESPECKSFLEASRFIALPAPEECTPHLRRQTFVLIGTCIAEGVRYFLHLSPAFRARFRLRHFITNRAARSMSEFVIGDALLHESAVVAHVAPQWADWGNEQAYIDLLARVPAHVQRISFPYPSFQPLWPFHCRDARQGQALPEGLWRPHEERPYYPYGDSFVQGLMRTVGSAEEIVRRYLQTDVAREIDLDKLLDHTLTIHREREAHTDVKVVDFLAENFRHTKLFDSINHITNRVALRIANQILARLDMAAIPEQRLQQTAEVLSPEMPIHPSVARHFGLRYISEQTRYAVDPHRRLTYAEFLMDYVTFV